jgi:hypothetical protein
MYAQTCLDYAAVSVRRRVKSAISDARVRSICQVQGKLLGVPGCCYFQFLLFEQFGSRSRDVGYRT